MGGACGNEALPAEPPAEDTKKSVSKPVVTAGDVSPPVKWRRGSAFNPHSVQLPGNADASAKVFHPKTDAVRIPVLVGPTMPLVNSLHAPWAPSGTLHFCASSCLMSALFLIPLD